MKKPGMGTAASQTLQWWVLRSEMGGAGAFWSSSDRQYITWLFSYPQLTVTLQGMKDWRPRGHGAWCWDPHVREEKSQTGHGSFGHGWVKQPFGLEQMSCVEKVKKKVTGDTGPRTCERQNEGYKGSASRTEDGKDGEMGAGRNASFTPQISTSNLGWTWLFSVEGSLPVEWSYRAWSSPGWREWQTGGILSWWVDYKVSCQYHETCVLPVLSGFFGWQERKQP